LNQLLNLLNNFVVPRKKPAQCIGGLPPFTVEFGELYSRLRRDFVQRITARNGLRPTSGRIRKAAPVTVALDVVTSTERRDEVHDSSVSLVRHVVLLLKLCAVPMAATRDSPHDSLLMSFDLSNSNKQCERANKIQAVFRNEKKPIDSRSEKF